MILIDPEDEAILAEGGWYVVFTRGDTTRPYVQRNFRENGRRWVEKLHRRILGVTDPEVQVDHRNGNGLDNRRENLRRASHGQNQRNRGANRNNKLGLKGVSANRGRFRATLMADRVIYRLGTFDTPELAHAAYAEAAGRLHKDFANTGLVPAEIALE